MISVIVPVLNAERVIEQVARALLEQDYPRDDYELIFVDNGCSDDSIRVLRRFPRIQIHQELRPGAYAARNHGLEVASGDVIAFTDADCVVDPGWLRALDEALSKPDVQVCLGRRLAASPRRRVQLMADYENNKARTMCGAHDPTVYYGYTNNMAVRRGALERFGPFAERARGSDTILVRRIVESLSCEAVVYVPAMLVRHTELDSALAYWRKARIYGRARRSHQNATPVRALPLRERIGLYRETVSGRSLVESSLVLAQLVVGALAWRWGRSSWGATAADSRNRRVLEFR